MVGGAEEEEGPPQPRHLLIITGAWFVWVVGRLLRAGEARERCVRVAAMRCFAHPCTPAHHRPFFREALNREEIIVSGGRGGGV